MIAPDAACPSADAIVRLLEGRASAVEADAIDRHVDRCAGCLGLLACLAVQQRGDDTAPATGDDTPLRRGDRVGRHVIGELIGRGGMGLVYAAEDPLLGRAVAIKVVRSPSGRPPTATERALLRREARAIARLSHPNVVPIHDVGQLDNGRLWVAMERVDGITLRVWTRTHANADWRARLDLLRGAGDALAAAHDAGIVHRDFKPDNVMVGHDGRVRVLDFGLARVQESPHAIESTLVSAREDGLATRGAIGTPAYMAPEQHHGRGIDARADQFAFAVTAWELLFGERPFAGASAAAIAEAIDRGEIRPPAKRGLDAIANVLRRALAADPEQRYPDMPTMLAKLRVDPSRRRRAAAFGLVALIVVACGFGLSRWNDSTARAACVEAAGIDLGMPSDPPSLAIAEAMGDDAQRVGERVDAFAVQWRDAELAQCVAGLERAAPGLVAVRACHREVAVAWSTAAAVIVAGDHAIHHRAMEILDDLPALADCEDPRRAPPMPRDAVAIARSVALRERLAAVTVMHRAGSDPAALAEVHAVVALARDAHDDATLAEALVRAGEVEEDAGDFTTAEQSYVEGYWLATRIGRGPVAIAAAAYVAQLVGNRLARSDDARDWIRHAEAILARTEEHDPARRGAVVLALAAIDHTDGRVDAAIDGFTRALDLYTEAYGAASGNVATMHANLAAALLDAGRYDDALAEADTALALHTKVWGADHPAIARDHLHRANALFLQGRLPDAEAAYVRALELARASLAADHPDLVAYYTGLGIVANASGRTDDALRWHRAALAIQERSIGDDHPDVALAVNNIGSVLSAAGRDEEAIPYFQRSLAIFRRAHGHDHAAVGSTLHDLALAHHGLDREREAIEGYRAAIATWTRVLGPRHAMIGRARMNLGNALLDDGQLDAAFAEYRLAVEIGTETVGEHDPSTARAWSRLGLALVRHGRSADAIEPLRRAIALREGGPEPDRVAELRYGLAQALRNADRSEARAQANTAAASFRTLGDVEMANTVDAWIRAL